jgi:two-component system CheB/CheR fusion protein
MSALPQEASDTSKGLVVVGIGASAGGLEALETFFTHTPPDSGLAFVVVQHLSPDFKSLMDELLSRHTNVAIRRVEDGMEVEPDVIYLLPPRKEMIISAGKLHLTDKDPAQSLSMPIDTFFRSLAQDCGARAVAVVLSGTGSDGSRGVVAVHEAGGLVIVQDPETAKFDGMPRSTLETGIVDLVLPPQRMPEALLHFLQRLPLDPGTGTDQPLADRSITDGMQSILKLLRTEYGIDFSHYKPSTVERRVERRLLLNQSVDLEAYAKQLAEDSGELNALYKDLLIGVTRFFRDPEAFDYLEHHVLPELVRRTTEQEELRFWVAGCATGEEAYSLAILLHEALTASKRPLDVKIFATDVHRASLEVASLGIYSAESLSKVSPARLTRYFVPHGDRFQVAGDLRKLIVFAPHNVIRDAPFTRLDLVTCRNLLIYFQPVAQKKVLGLFHFGLKAGGILFLGPSESPGELADEFEPLQAHWRIYRKRRDIRLPPDLRLSNTLLSPPARLPVPGTPPASPLPDPQLLRVYDNLLDECIPPSLLLNERRELIHCFAGAGKFLRYRDGRPTVDVLELVDNDLKLALAGALHRVVSGQGPVRYTGIRLATAEGPQEITLAVRRLEGRSITPHLLVTFENAAPVEVRPAEEAFHMDRVSREQLQNLEAELLYTRENLQATLEEMETSNEELQAANEELIASNEELQSTNEELHSVNEELYTVNAEYQRKITELTELTDDLDNLFRNLEEGVAFLDRDLCIRRFTPPLARVFQFLPQDVGRRIDTFAHNIAYDRLVEDLTQVMNSQTSLEKEVVDRQRRYYLLRIAPYRTRARVEGVILKLLDVTRLKEAEKRLRLLSKVFMDGADPIIIEDLSGNILDLNAEAERVYGWPRKELIGQNIEILQPESWRGQALELRQRCLAQESVRNVETVRRTKNGAEYPVLKSLSLLSDDNGEPVAIASIAKDIRSLKEAEKDARRNAQELASANQVLQDMVQKRLKAEAEAKEAVRRRDEFLAMLSHELRNPLSAILTATYILARPDADASRMREAGQLVQRQAKTMARLLDDLLDVARVTEGKIELHRESLDLTQLAPEVLQAAKPLLEGRGHQVEMDIAPTPLPVLGDRTRLLQIQMNLLSNAAKYTQPGGNIRLAMRQEGDHAVIRVRDNGMGIAAEMLERIFDLFVQAENTLHRSEGGMGVGLTLVRRLVALHGGQVTAHSDGLGQGSEFVVRLPLHVEAAAGQEEKDASPTTSAQKRILVVEDIADSREMLRTLLELDGHQVTVAADGLAGLEAIQQSRFDLALVDVGLPGLDGYEVARRVRSSPELQGLFLVALTGYGREEDRRAVREAGFDLHIVKPLKLNDLTEVMTKLAQRQRRPIPR